MAATLDDLLYVATAQRVDIRFALDRIEQALTGNGGGKGPPAPVGAQGAAPSFFGGLTGGPARILAIFGALEKGLTSFGAQVARFVSLASPAHILKWNVATADLQAVIGRMLLPTMEKLTLMVRKLADTLANLSPEAQKLAVGLGVGAGLGGVLAAVAVAVKALVLMFGGVPVIIGTVVAAFVGIAATLDSGKSIMTSFNAVLRATVTLFESLARALVPLLEFGLVPVLDNLASAVRDIAAGVEGVVNAARSLLGLEAASRTDRSSVGAAVRGAQIGDVQSFVNRAYTNAFQGSANTVEERQLEELKGIRAILARSGPLPREDSWASARPGAERLDRALGGNGSIGRGVGGYVDAISGPFTMAPRAVVAVMREVFG